MSEDAGAPPETPALDSAAETPEPQPSTEPANDNADPWDVDALPGEYAERMVKMKVNGEDVLVPLAKALKNSQRTKALTQKEMALADRERQRNAEIEQMFDNPDMLASKTGAERFKKLLYGAVKSNNPETQQLVAQVFQRLQAESEMKPEELQKTQLDREREEFEARKAAYERERQEAQQQAETQQHVDAYQKEFTAALEAQTIPNTKQAIARTANLMAAAIDRGVELSVAEAADIVAEEYRDEMTGVLSQMPDEALGRFLGQDMVRRFGKMAAADVRQEQAKPPKAKPNGAPAKKKGDPPESTEDLRKRLGLGGGM